MRALPLLLASSCLSVSFGEASGTEAGGGSGTGLASSVATGGTGAGGAPTGGASTGGAPATGGSPATGGAPTSSCLPVVFHESFDSPGWLTSSSLGVDGHPGAFDPSSPRWGAGAWRTETEAGSQNSPALHSSVVRSSDDIAVGGEYWFAVSLLDDGVVSNSWSNLRLECASTALFDTLFVLETKPTEPFAVWGDYLSYLGLEPPIPIELTPGASGYVDLWMHFSFAGAAGTFVELYANGELVFEASGNGPFLGCQDLGLRFGIERNPEPFDDTLTVDEAVLLRVDTIDVPFTLDDVFFTLTPESDCFD